MKTPILINETKMNKIVISLIALVLMFGCKNTPKEKKGINNNTEIVKEIILPNYPLWLLNRLALNTTNENLNLTGKQVFTLSRTSTTETAYASVNNIPVTFGNYYRASVLVKKDDLGGFFGLRIIGEYPNRADAIFDLEKGLLKEVIDVGEFFNGEAKIENIDNGWYKCSLSVEVNSNKMKIILGPTSGSNKAITWEGVTNEECGVLIIPSSLVLEELSN